MNRLALSFFGSGYIRPAPGTWGSLAALPAAWLIYLVAGPFGIAIGAALLYALGIYALNAELKDADDHDPSWVVIDEVVGQWIALLPIAFGAYNAGVSPLALWPGIVAAFLFFRLFDIWKPWVIGKVDARGDATGVMLDDVLAGLFAAIVVLALAALVHSGVLGEIPDQQ
ncbi:MAG: phosphatidylglycerophosphatase A [Boseongicola sp.]|nr:phosphatidylglycerophosphatase A [Boseongicola sp.]